MTASTGTTSFARPSHAVTAANLRPAARGSTSRQRRGAPSTARDSGTDIWDELDAHRGRLRIVSYRGPITVEKGRVNVSTGGLATAFSTVLSRGQGGDWLAYLGLLSRVRLVGERKKLEEAKRSQHVVPVHLNPVDVDGHYIDVTNIGFWPLFHGYSDLMEAYDLGPYRRVNEQFAEASAAENAKDPGGPFWVQDYQLLLVPQLLRERIPDEQRGPIGYFHHIPFPPVEIFSVAPGREEVLRGMLGADLVGFQTALDARNFREAAVALLGAVRDEDGALHWNGRRVEVRAFPIGMDFEKWNGLASEVEAEARALREKLPVKRVIAVDRLDYTKGIDLRLKAFYELLKNNPRFRPGQPEAIQLTQVAVPNRTKVPAYKRHGILVRHWAKKIIKEFGEEALDYRERNLPAHELAALYRAADVAWVTPRRDGMNLVAKEFIACRVDEDRPGALLLSPGAGAARELVEAVMVNPFSASEVQEQLLRALNLPVDEASERMRVLRERVQTNDVHAWTRRYLEALLATHPSPARASSSPEEIEAAVERLAPSDHLALLAEYDGALRAYQDLPQSAAPGDSLRSLLSDLQGLDRTAVHVFGGRSRRQMGAWFGDLDIDVYANNGGSRMPAGEWTWRDGGSDEPAPWLETASALLTPVHIAIQGSRLDLEDNKITLHYRLADAQQAREELDAFLAAFAGSPDFDVIDLPDAHALEVRPKGLNTGRVISDLEPELAAPRTSAVVLTAGHTDPELLAALPEGAFRIAVLSSPNADAPEDADLVLASPAAAQDFLRRLSEARAALAIQQEENG